MSKRKGACGSFLHCHDLSFQCIQFEGHGKLDSREQRVVSQDHVQLQYRIFISILKSNYLCGGNFGSGLEAKKIEKAIIFSVLYRNYPHPINCLKETYRSVLWLVYRREIPRSDHNYDRLIVSNGFVRSIGTIKRSLFCPWNFFCS